MSLMSELGIKYGLKASLPDPRHHRFAHCGDPNALPPSASLLEHLGAIRDQETLGCCVGEGTSKALRILLAKNKYKWLFTPSVLDIYYQCRKKEGTVNSDSGAMISDAMDVLRNLGVCPEDSNHEWSWPFSAKDDRWKQEPPAECEKNALSHKIVKYAKVDQNVESIKAALAKGLPVVIGTLVYPSFEKAPNGVIPMPSFLERLIGPLGGHCTVLWGYGNYSPDHADGANSWGESWGDKGSYHIPFSYLTDPTLTSDLWTMDIVA